VKLKHHRLKPGGVQALGCSFLALKLKHHRLKPGGVQAVWGARLLALKLKHHRLKPGGVQAFQPLVLRNNFVCNQINSTRIWATRTRYSSRPLPGTSNQLTLSYR